MKQGYLDGRITEERLDEALHRILALKAHMGLHKKAKQELMPPKEQITEVIGCESHVAMQKEISEKAITLVKYKDKDVLPITPERYKRIMIVYVKGLSAPGLASLFGKGKITPAEQLRDKLKEKGFDAFIYESPLDDMVKKMESGENVNINLYFAERTPIKEFRERQDLIITLVDIAGGFQPVARPAFGMTKGGGEIPWYVFELPVLSVILTQMRLLRVEWMKKGRRVIIIVIFVVAALITPPDIVSQIMIAIPMIGLYELSILICSFLMRFKKPDQEEEE